MKTKNDLLNDLTYDKVFEIIHDFTVKLCELDKGMTLRKSSVTGVREFTLDILLHKESVDLSSMEKDEAQAKVVEISERITHHINDHLRSLACEMYAPTIDPKDVNSAMIHIMLPSGSEMKQRSNVILLRLYL